MSKRLSEKPYETRVQKHGRILRKHGYQPIALYPAPTATEPGHYLEVWGRAGNTLILQVWPKEDACCVYVNDGNPTWEEWERRLS